MGECKKFQADVMGGKDSLATVKIEDVKDAAKYDAIFYVGGVGVMWDFPKKLIETYTYWFAKFEARLEENEKRGATKGFFVGNALSIADLKGLSTFAATSNVPGVADLFEKFARLNAWFNRMNANEDIKAAQTIYNANYAAFR